MRGKTWAVALVCALLPMSLPARVITVDDRREVEFTTIQAGIDAASEGDTVLVAAGTYSGPGNRDLDFGGTNLHLLGAGPGSTIIDCGGSSGEPHRGFYFHSGEDSASVVSGFAIRHGWHDFGSGALCTASAPVLENLAFADHDSPEGIVHCTDSPIRLEHVTFSSSPGRDALGMYCSRSPAVLEWVTFSGIRENGALVSVDNSDVTIRDCVFEDCGGAIAQAGAFWCSDSSPTLERVRFEGNDSVSRAGGMLCDRSSPSLTDVRFAENETYWGVGGLACYGGASLTLTRVEFVGNAGSLAGGMRCDGILSPVLEDVSFLLNYSNNGDGAMSCVNSSPILEDVVFEDNMADFTPGSGGLRISGPCSPQLDRVTFARNINGGYASALLCTAGATPSLHHVTFSGNTGYGFGEEAAIVSDRSSPHFTDCIIAFTEEGAAIRCSGTSTPNLEHCCSYGNAEGDSLCGDHTDNLFVDPLFCGPPSNDLTLRDDSPCLPENNPWDEIIGAHGAGGCGTGVPEIPQEVPTALALYPASPNPFSPATKIAFDLSQPAEVTLQVYDIAGKLVRVLARSAQYGPGHHALEWDGRGSSGRVVSSGVYVCLLEVGGRVLMKSMVLLR